MDYLLQKITTLDGELEWQEKKENLLFSVKESTISSHGVGKLGTFLDRIFEFAW